ncbi:protein disulfide-isomerase [Plasmodium gaboni]|uniref:Protein disulfide-isomerase n=1 Tax=Plasmodium gaboni TaxID=647221 RepID=A0ABY1UVQ4_9APIC|nr:protein disulfide-isomerase [Plasmodium gaboni]
MHIEKFLFFFFFFLIKLCVCHTDDEVKKEIVSINFDEFNNILKEEVKYTLLIVYTHWSYNSNLLLDNLDKISKLLLDEENIKLCKINAALNTSIIDKLDVYGYPSLFMIRNNEIHRYNGMNNIRDLLLWIYQYLDSKIYEINNIERLNMFIELNEYNNTILFFIFKDLITPNNNTNNISVINDLINICILTNKTLCFYIKEKNIIEYFEQNIIQDKYHYNINNINQYPYYSLLYKNDEFDDYIFPLHKKELNMLTNKEYTNEHKINLLYNWISEKEQPLVIQFAEYFFSMLFSNDTVTLFIIYNDIKDINKEDIIKSAKKYNNKIKFAISGTTQIYEKRLLNELLIDDNIKKPLMRITEFKNDIRFPYKYKPKNDDQEINEKTIDEFVNGYLQEKKYFYRKSERALPDEYNNGYIKIIVADNYDNYIYRNDMNVIVLYYAPWCGHCYKFEPIYREVGKRLNLYADKFKNFKNDIIISKIDAVNNEIYNINIEGYPTIYLYKKGDKLNPVRYMDGRTVKNIITWICEETQSNIDISEFLNIDLDNEQLFENYEEL